MPEAHTKPAPEATLTKQPSTPAASVLGGEVAEPTAMPSVEAGTELDAVSWAAALPGTGYCQMLQNLFTRTYDAMWWKEPPAGRRGLGHLKSQATQALLIEVIVVERSQNSLCQTFRDASEARFNFPCQPNLWRTLHHAGPTTTEENMPNPKMQPSQQSRRLWRPMRQGGGTERWRSAWAKS